jgi:hypothetical protein
MFRKFFVAVPIAVIAISGSTACATKKFVRTSVGEVNEKVDSLGRSVEETQERTRKNEGRISEVDQKAQAAAQSATQSCSLIALSHWLLATGHGFPRSIPRGSPHRTSFPYPDAYPPQNS